jgi:hypothetical protein
MDWFFAYIHQYDRQIKLKRVPPCDCENRKLHYGKYETDKLFCDYHFEVQYSHQNTNILYITPLFEAINASAGWDLAIQYCRLAGWVECTVGHLPFPIWRSLEEMDWPSIKVRFARLDL